MRRRSALVILATLLTVGTAACSGATARPPAPAPVRGPLPDIAKGKYADWIGYHGGMLRHGYAATMPAAHGPLRVVKRLHLDGAVYASPLVIHGVTVVATENDTVYAFGPRFHRLWKRHLGAPAQQSELPCGDIFPLGITGTPAYDATTGTVFVAPEFAGRNGAAPTHQLYALTLTSGRVRWHRGLDFPGVERAAMQERGALALDGKRVYVPFGGLAGDCSQYKGRVVGRLRSTGRKPIRYTVPTAREAGIWTPPGPTVSRGDLFVAVGNGASGSSGRYDHSDSVLRLGPGLHLQQSFSPRTWRVDNENDLDLGSQGPAVVGRWVFSDGKRGTAYVLRRRHLGGIGGAVHSRSIGASYGGTAVKGHDVYVPTT